MENNAITPQDLNLPEYKGFMADLPSEKDEKEIETKKTAA